MKEIFLRPRGAFRALAVLFRNSDWSTFAKNLAVYAKGLWLGGVARDLAGRSHPRPLDFHASHDGHGRQHRFANAVELHGTPRRHRPEQLAGGKIAACELRPLHFPEWMADGRIAGRAARSPQCGGDAPGRQPALGSRNSRLPRAPEHHLLPGESVSGQRPPLSHRGRCAVAQAGGRVQAAHGRRRRTAAGPRGPGARTSA